MKEGTGTGTGTGQTEAGAVLHARPFRASQLEPVPGPGTLEAQ